MPPVSASSSSPVVAPAAPTSTLDAATQQAIEQQLDQFSTLKDPSATGDQVDAVKALLLKNADANPDKAAGAALKALVPDKTPLTYGDLQPAVLSYQNANGLQPDKEAGQQTIASLLGAPPGAYGVGPLTGKGATAATATAVFAKTHPTTTAAAAKPATPAGPTDQMQTVAKAPVDLSGGAATGAQAPVPTGSKQVFLPYNQTPNSQMPAAQAAAASQGLMTMDELTAYANKYGTSKNAPADQYWRAVMTGAAFSKDPALAGITIQSIGGVSMQSINAAPDMTELEFDDAFAKYSSYSKIKNDAPPDLRAQMFKFALSHDSDPNAQMIHSYMMEDAQAGKGQAPIVAGAAAPSGNAPASSGSGPKLIGSANDPSTMKAADLVTQFQSFNNNVTSKLRNYYGVGIALAPAASLAGQTPGTTFTKNDISPVGYGVFSAWGSVPPKHDISDYALFVQDKSGNDNKWVLVSNSVPASVIANPNSAAAQSLASQIAGAMQGR
jgi:hypothetical protein